MSSPENRASTPVLHLRCPTGGPDSASIVYEGLDVTILYRFSDDRKRSGRITFCHVVAFRFSDTHHGDVPAENTWNRIVAFPSSQWIDSLLASEPATVRASVSVKSAQHFAVFIADHGYLEVVARDGVSQWLDDEWIASSDRATRR